MFKRNYSTEKKGRGDNASSIVIETGPLLASLRRVALPIALQSIIAASLSLVDNVMVGMLGEKELAAVGMSTQIFFIHWMMLFGFTSGMTTFMSQLWGIQDLKSIRKTIGLAITACLAGGMLFFLPAMIVPDKIVGIFTDNISAIEIGGQYVRIGAWTILFVSISVPISAALRSTQQTRIPLFVSVLSFSLNTFMNYCLIFGHFGLPQLGISGAVIATVISRGLEVSLYLFLLLKSKNVLRGRLGEFFGIPREDAKRMFKNAIPTTLNETLWGVGTSAYVAAYGHISIVAMAAVQAGNTINNMFILAGFSIGDAILIMVGQRLGRNQYDYAYELAKKLLGVAVMAGVVGGVLLITLGRPLLNLFDFTAEGAKYAFLILCVYSAAMPLKLLAGANIVGTLRCGGDTAFAMRTEISCVWGIGVPLAFIGSLGLKCPVYVVVAMVQIEEAVKCIIVMLRFRSKKWVKNVIDDLSITTEEIE